jgi:cell pole-organizing protein PopZ
MGEAAVKEPSMEDILSSIRKIISEEGAAPEQDETSFSSQSENISEDNQSTSKMSDMLDQVRSSEPVEAVAEASSPAIQTSSDVSGSDAAKMASTLSTLKDEVGAEPEVASNLEVSPEANSEEATTSFASIVENVVEQEVEETPMSEPVMLAPVEETQAASEAVQTTHVEMSEATPAPTSEIETPISASAVETIVEDEMAFKGALMSPSSNGEVSNAFDRLKRSTMDDIDAKTEAILRPMLREWLDENLPNMVERLVREEIERVARGV